MTSGHGSARLDQRGRLVLPAALRRRLSLHPGDEVVIREEPEGVLRVESRRAAAHALVGLAGPSDGSAVEQLLDMRRGEAASEDADAQRTST